MVGGLGLGVRCCCQDMTQKENAHLCDQGLICFQKRQFVIFLAFFDGGFFSHLQRISLPLLWTGAAVHSADEEEEAKGGLSPRGGAQTPGYTDAK